MTKVALKTIFSSTEYSLLKRQRQFVLYSDHSDPDSDSLDEKSLNLAPDKIRKGSYLLPLLKSTLPPIVKQKESS